jgi:hypothetical protein
MKRTSCRADCFRSVRLSGLCPGRSRVPGALVSIAFLLMAACSHDRAGKDPLDIPVDEGQRTLTVDAVNGLRDAFNSGACQSIYEQAAAHFRTQSLQEWMSQCKDLKETLGSWQSFSAHLAERCGGGPSVVIVCAGGNARFAKRIAQVDVAWLLDKGRTQLMWISLKKGQGAWVVIPPWRGPRMFDTPPRPFPKSGRAG